MSEDTRPINCRQRLIDEGPAYPKSGCQGCGMSVFDPGYGKNCEARTEENFGMQIVARKPSEQVAFCVAKLEEMLAPPQAVIDGVTTALKLAIKEIEELEAKTLDNEGPAPRAISDIVGIGWAAVFNNCESRKMTVINYVVVQTGGPSPAPMFFPDQPAGEKLQSVTCAWHDEQGRPQQADYPPEALFMVPPRA